MGDPNKIRIVSVDATWAIEEKFKVTCVADSSGSLNNKYFTFSDLTTNYYVWYNINSAGVDPAPGGTGIEVAGATGASATTLSGATVTAINGSAAAVTATQSGASFTVVLDTAGSATDAADGDTGFTISKLQDGGTIDLGLLDGNVEVSFEEQLLEVTAHQSGLTPRSVLRQGVIGTVTLTLKEFNLDIYKELISSTAGGAFTPSGGSTEVFGWGDNKLGLNGLVNARRLQLHPTTNSASDYSEDLCFWKAYPKPNSIVYSGEEPSTVSIEFACFQDDAKNSQGKFFVFGDWTQMIP